MTELLYSGPARVAFRVIGTRGALGKAPYVSVKSVELRLYAVKAESQLGIGTTELATSSNPPLSRTLVCAMDELTMAWMQDIVAIVNMTSAMLASVVPVRNFLFIGYAIAVRTTGRQVRPRTIRVARPSTASLLNRTTSSPPRIRSRPITMNRVMSAVAVLNSFHGLSSQASMRAPAAVKTIRGDRSRIVRIASPTARADGPASCRIKFLVTRATIVPIAPSAARLAPKATCLWVERRWT